jgi:hypothetical protein
MDKPLVESYGEMKMRLQMYKWQNRKPCVHGEKFICREGCTLVKSMTNSMQQEAKKNE